MPIILLLPQQELFESLPLSIEYVLPPKHPPDPIGAITQNEKAGIRMMAGNFQTTENVSLIPIEIFNVTKA